MSRIIEQIATVQFQVQTRQASATMQALQEAARDLAKDMDSVNEKIAALGKDVPKDNPQLLNYQNMLRSIKKDHDDIMKAQRDFMRGAKAADQLWKAAQEQNIESLSFRSIKSGISGLRKRQEGLSAGDAKDMQDWRIIQNVIQEADRIVKEATADVQNTIQVIRDGGKVSEQAMRQTINALRDLRGSVDETDADFYKWGGDLDFMEGKLKEFSDAQRRARGEMVDANDARREALKLTKEGAEAAARERDAADEKIASLKKEGEELIKNRELIKQNIETTRKEIDEQHKLIEKKHSELAADEGARKIIFDADRAHIEGLQTQAKKERALANEKSDAAEKQMRYTELLEQRTDKLGQKVVSLQEKLAKVNAEPVKPKVDSSEIDALQKSVDKARVELFALEKDIAAAERDNGAFASHFEQRAKSQGSVTGKGKPAKLKVDDFTSTQANRPAMGGIYHDESGYGVVSDGFVLMYDKALYDKKNKGKIIATHADKKNNFQAGDVIDGKFPNWKSVTDVSYSHTGKADLKALSDFLTGVNEREKESWKKAKESGETKDTFKEWLSKSNVVLKLPDGQYAILGTSTLTKTVNAAKEMGAEEMSWDDRDESSIQFKGKRGGALVMRKAMGEGSSRDELLEQSWAYEMKQGETTSVSLEDKKARYAQLKEEIESKEKIIEQNNKITAATQQSTAATEQQTAATKSETQATETQEELEEQLAKAKKEHKASQEQLNKEREKSAKLQGEAIEQDNKAATAEGKVADATKETTDAQAKYNIKMEEGLQDVKNMENAQTDMQIKLDGQEQQLKENSEAYSKNAQDTAKAEADKRQAQELTIQQMEEMKALLEQENRETVPANTEKWRENEAEIERLDQKIREYKGEWMSLEEAQTFASRAGKDGFIATAQQLQQAQQAMERYRESLIKTIQQKQRDGDVTDKEEQELAELEQQMKDLKFEQDNFNMSHKKMQNLLSEPTKATDLDELKAAIKRADGELHRMQNSLGENSKEYQAFAEQVKNAKNVLKDMEGQAKATASAWDKAWSRLKTYVGMYMGFNIVWSKFTATGGDLLTLSDKMGEVRKTTGFTADEVGKLSDNLAKLDTRTNLTGLMEFSSLAGSIGMKTQEQVQGFTEAANMLAVSLPEMGNEASRTLMKIADATGDLEKNGGNVRETLERVGSTIIALRANSAAAAGPITDFVSRVGAVGAQAGISIDQIAALGATVDALGGRVEMSATALSRMIPAIRNNTFEVAKAIGMTEKELKGKTAMEQMIAIFKSLRDSAKGFDTSTEEGMNAMADSVEKALGRSTSMQDVMKELNQQGARAGIVFGLLSQNVDKLEEQLETAGEAYSKNTALMNEYNKMNDTTAAKWERLKNQLEEFLVGDKSQRFFGWIFDQLRKLVDLITEDGPLAKGIRYLAIYATMVKAQWAEAIGSILLSLGKYVWSMRESTIATEADTAAKVKNYTITTTLGDATEETSEKTGRLSKAWGKLNATMKANIIAAVAAALIYLGSVAYDYAVKTREAIEEVGRFNQQISEERKALDDLFEPLHNSNLAQEERSKLIGEINKKYGTYLGYMLSETASAVQLADAHALIAKRIREEAYERRIAEKEKQIQEEYNDEMNENYGRIVNRVRSGAKGNADVEKIADDLKNLVDKNMDRIEQRWGGGLKLDPAFDKEINGFLGRLVDDGKLRQSSIGNVRASLLTYMNTAKSQHNDIMGQTSNMRSDLRNIQGAIKYDLANNINTLVSKVANSVSNAVKQAQGNAPRQNGVPSLLQRPQGGGIPNLLGGGKTQSNGKWQNPWQQSYDTTPQQQAAPEGWKPNVNKKDVEAVRKFVENQEALRGALQAGGEQIDEAQRKVAESYLLSEQQLKEYRDIITNAERNGGSGGSGGGSNPYGDYNKVTDDYSKWNGDDLVNRRKEMLQRVRALANGADVQAVLSEDAKFIKDAVRKNIKTTEQAIEWYNTERLKIQEALHAKHLTNTGDWLDPKKGAAKRTSQLVQDEMKYYLDELDAYYTERKAKIQEAQNDQEISEAEARNRTIANEAEWQQRRGELIQLYANKAVKVTKEEQDAIFDILAERTGDTTSYIQKDIANTVKLIEKVGTEKSKEAMDKIYGDLDKKTEQAFLKQRNAIGQHMKAIQDIIDKERPFNGITKNLETNLTTMGILSGHMEKELAKLMKEGGDIADFNRRQAEEQFKELTFFLAESEHAYTTTAEEVMRRAADAGLTEWVEYMKQNPKMQEGLMAQLRLTFDSVHEAIKKEASLLKKEAETMWNNILMPDGMTTLKQAFDQTISTLGIEQGRVSRANNLIGAGQASERVADKLAIQQIKVQMAMQKAYYDLMKQRGQAQVDILEKQSAELREQGKLEEAKRVAQDAQHARMALNLATTKEQTEQLKLQEDLAAKVEESQARLYKELKSWADIFTKGLQGVFEAVNFYNSSDYNNLAVARAGGSYNKKTTKTTSYSTSSKVTDTGKHSTSSSASSTSTKTNKTDASDASQASKTSYTDTNRDQSTNRSATSDTHSTTNTSQAKTSTTTTEKIQSYYIIDNAGTKDAVAREVEMSEEEYYEKKIELDRDNAIKEAWKNLLDELNMKMSETITDQINAMFQDAAVNANTDAAKLNTEALKLNTEAQGRLTEALNGLAAAQAAEKTYDFSGAYKVGGTGVLGTGDMGLDEEGVPNALKVPEGEGSTSLPKMPWQMTEEEMEAAKGQAEGYFQFAGEKMIETDAMLKESGVKPFTPQVMTDEEMETVKTQAEEYNISVADTLRAIKEEMAEEGIESINPKILSDEEMQAINDQVVAMSQVKIDTSNKETAAIANNAKKQTKEVLNANNQTANSTQSTFAKMAAAANMYGIAYQTMSNNNLSTAQKVEMFALQAAGQAAISALTMEFAENETKTKVMMPGIFGKLMGEMPYWAALAAYAGITATMGGLMALAMSSLTKGKSEIAQATGASPSATNVSAGKLMTGMLTYGEGNVNEFTDPSTLQQGRYYIVDSNDGRTYRARYMGTDPKTHITNGPEFHLVGERGREAIIDAHTTRLMQMDDTGIWQAIQTLYNGGSLQHSVMRRKGRGMAAFADGNIGEFETMADGGGLMAGGAGLSSEQMMALQASIDRQSDLLERAMTDGIHAYFDVYGRGGLIDSYDTGKKTVTSHGERY